MGELAPVLRGAMAAREVFFRRELFHCALNHDPDATLAVLELGGTGRAMLRLAGCDVGAPFTDLLVVTETPDDEVLAETGSWPIDTTIRFDLRRRCPVDYLLDRDATALRPRDLVFSDALLDFLDDSTATRLVESCLLRLRRGGIFVAATLDSDLPETEVAAAAARFGVRPRDAQSLSELLARVSPTVRFRMTLLERGPNRYALLRRE